MGTCTEQHQACQGWRWQPGPAPATATERSLASATSAAIWSGCGHSLHRPPAGAALAAADVAGRPISTSARAADYEDSAVQVVNRSAITTGATSRKGASKWRANERTTEQVSQRGARSTPRSSCSEVTTAPGLAPLAEILDLPHSGRAVVLVVRSVPGRRPCHPEVVPVPSTPANSPTALAETPLSVSWWHEAACLGSDPRSSTAVIERTSPARP